MKMLTIRNARRIIGATRNARADSDIDSDDNSGAIAPRAGFVRPRHAFQVPLHIGTRTPRGCGTANTYDAHMRLKSHASAWVTKKLRYPLENRTTR